MGIQDRDYVRERRLRWDERPGEMRLEDEEPRRRGLNFQWRPGRWVMLAVAVAVIGLYGANHWMSRNTLPVANDVGGGSSPDTAADVPAVPVEQGPENPVLIGTVTQDDMHRTKQHAQAAPPATVMPLVQQPTAAAAGECRIKGNISGSGHIYHVPGSASYNATRIDTSKGERWFCSEEEAEAAGWRAPRG